MIKYWQSMHDYLYFLTEFKVHFDSSERNRLHTELWKAWQKLRLFDTDKAMEFLLPFYSSTGSGFICTGQTAPGFLEQQKAG